MNPTTDWGLYIHVPWCRGICPYCGFFVRKEPRQTPWAEFVAALHREFAQRGPMFEGPPATVFLGGGTPSRLPQAQLAALLELAPDAKEISMECNPEDIDGDWTAHPRLTRISLGVQSLHDRHAALLGRLHTAAVAERAIARVKDAVPTWSIDLIFGVPGQTLDDVHRDLEAMLGHDPPHMSLYGLTFEPNTPFERARVAGRMQPIDPDLWADMYNTIVSTLRGAGLERYEVSNFARPGHRSGHNQLYWTDAPYMGIGPSAHGYLPDGRRYSNLRDIEGYLSTADPTADIERPTAHERASDILVSVLRTPRGVDHGWLAERTGMAVDHDEVALLQQAGLLLRTTHRIALSDSGFPVSDAVIARLAGALRPIKDRET